MKKLKFVEDNNGVRLPWVYLHSNPYKEYTTDLIDFENCDEVLKSKEYNDCEDCKFECEDKYGNKATLFMSKCWHGMVGLVVLHSDELYEQGMEDTIRMAKRF